MCLKCVFECADRFNTFIQFESGYTYRGIVYINEYRTNSVKNLLVVKKIDL